MSFARLTTIAAVLLLVSCSSEESCHEEPSGGADCADLVFGGRSYTEGPEVTLPAITQELGDATYPACNAAGTCADRGVGSNGATDVWLAEGVEPEHALIGYREGTRTPILFVERGTDLEDVEQHLDPALLD
jgi:small ligand-binding sensory domain FIST